VHGAKTQVVFVIIIIIFSFVLLFINASFEVAAFLQIKSFSSFHHQFENWFAAAFHSALLPAFLFISTYVVQPTSFIICFMYTSQGLPL
jgi:hypothetical protein